MTNFNILSIIKHCFSGVKFSSNMYFTRLGRDYIVAAMTKSEMSSYPKTIKIEPAYDLLEEPDFNIPTTGNFIYPKGDLLGIFIIIMIIKVMTIIIHITT